MRFVKKYMQYNTTCEMYTKSFEQSKSHITRPEESLKIECIHFCTILIECVILIKPLDKLFCCPSHDITRSAIWNWTL